MFGKAAGFAANLDLSTLDGTNGFKLSGVAADDYSGCSVASAGDVNGDGFADLIVGARGADPHGSNSGASYVVFGKAAGFGANLDLSTLNGTNGFKLSGVAADDRSGCSVASAGDVNGDGFADLIVGASGADPHGRLIPGRAMWCSARPAGFAANLDLSDPRRHQRLQAQRRGDTATSAAVSVASAGDVNGDGFADLIVGAYGRRSARQPFRGELCGVRQGARHRGHRRNRLPARRLAGGEFEDSAQSGFGGDDALRRRRQRPIVGGDRQRRDRRRLGDDTLRRRPWQRPPHRRRRRQLVRRFVTEARRAERRDDRRRLAQGRLRSSSTTRSAQWRKRNDSIRGDLARLRRRTARRRERRRHLRIKHT